MNEEHRKFFDLPFEKREKAFFKMLPEGKQLKKKLLSIGGEKVVWLPEEPHLGLLIKNGQSFSLEKRKKVKGEVNRCHTNAAKLFFEKDYNIVTGYALSGDRWIQHSWGFDGKRVIETTCLFDAYYGAILSGLEITKFICQQLGNEVMKFSPDQLGKLPLPKNLEGVL